MTALAQRCKIAWGIVGRIMIEVGTCQYNARLPHAVEGRKWSNDPSLPVPPFTSSFIPPISVRNTPHPRHMRSTAPFAAPLRPAEADCGRQLRPVYWVKPAMFGTNWHRLRSAIRRLKDRDDESNRVIIESGCGGGEVPLVTVPLSAALLDVADSLLLSLNCRKRPFVHSLILF